jgi:hypothetical protein
LNLTGFSGLLETCHAIGQTIKKSRYPIPCSFNGNLTFGWDSRSIGSQVIGEQGKHWLHMVSEKKWWVQKDWWEGNLVANYMKGIPMPTVIKVHDWHIRY